jgi:serine/threonine protein kinase
MLGQLLDGRYLVEKELGAGSFGKTYLARDIRLPGKPTCVVKQLQPQSDDPKVLQIASRLFSQEAEVLQKLGEHPQIPRLLAYFELDFKQNKEFFLVQEFIDGSDLYNEVCRGQKWTEAEVKAILEQILNPLAAAHKEKVIHRDITPANLMRRKSDGQIFLIDFGAVKQVAAAQVNHLAQTGTVGIGTRGYMPIEQIVGKPHLGGSDVYALGILALQALTGTSDATSLMDANTAQIQWRHLAHVSPEFGAVLDKMVANAVVNRYQSAQEVIGALESMAIGGCQAINVQPVGNSLSLGTRRSQSTVISSGTSKSTVVIKNPRNRRNWLIGLVAVGGVIALGWQKNRVLNDTEKVLSTTNTLDFAVAQSLLERWFAAKNRALSKIHDTTTLHQILAEPALTRARIRSQEAKESSQ